MIQTSIISPAPTPEHCTSTKKSSEPVFFVFKKPPEKNCNHFKQRAAAAERPRACKDPRSRPAPAGFKI